MFNAGGGALQHAPVTTDSVLIECVSAPKSINYNPKRGDARILIYRKNFQIRTEIYQPGK